jgi:hypothetical protein
MNRTARDTVVNARRRARRAWLARMLAETPATHDPSRTARDCYDTAATPEEVGPGLPYYPATVTEYPTSLHCETVGVGPFCADCARGMLAGAGPVDVLLAGTRADCYDPDQGGILRSCAGCGEDVI